MQDHPSLDLSPALREAFIRFLQYHPAKRVSKNLRTLLLEILNNEEPMAADALRLSAFDLEGLFALLDVAEAEWKEIHE
jgi:hypothetical protein